MSLKVNEADPAQPQKQLAQTITDDKLVNGPILLDRVFDPDCRPTLRWLRGMTKARKIPFMKLGGKVLFDVPSVRQWLAAKKVAAR